MKRRTDFKIHDDKYYRLEVTDRNVRADGKIKSVQIYFCGDTYNFALNPKFIRVKGDVASVMGHYIKSTVRNNIEARQKWRESNKIKTGKQRFPIPEDTLASPWDPQATHKPDPAPKPPDPVASQPVATPDPVASTQPATVDVKPLLKALSQTIQTTKHPRLDNQSRDTIKKYRHLIKRVMTKTESKEIDRKLEQASKTERDTEAIKARAAEIDRYLELKS